MSYTVIAGIIAASLHLAIAYIIWSRGRRSIHPLKYQNQEVERTALLKSLKSREENEEIAIYLTKKTASLCWAFNAYIDLYTHYFSTGLYNDAYLTLEKLLRRLHRYPPIEGDLIVGCYIRKMQVLMAMDQIAEAEGVFIRTEALNVASEYLSRLYAECAEKSGDIPEAILRLERQIERVPTSHRLWAMAARYERRLGMLEHSDMTYTEMQGRFPHVISGYIPYALNAHEKQDWPEATRRWNLVRTMFPLNPDSYTLGSVALTAQGRDTEAGRLLLDHPGDHSVSWNDELA